MVKPLLDLLEQRFAISLDYSPGHLQLVYEHYLSKREHLLHTKGEAGALAHPDYAKAVMISEAAKMLLREIMPRPRRRKKISKDKK